MVKTIQILFISITVLIILPSEAKSRDLVLATTTSIDNSGLLKYLLPKAYKKFNFKIKTLVRGTGAVLRIGINGDADILLVHDKQSEISFVEKGYGSFRKEVMTSHFILIGPSKNPAYVLTNENTANALHRIANSKSLFISRGDESGTHKAEVRLWNLAGIIPNEALNNRYLETGSGMGATLNMASALNAYTITESGSWAKFNNRGNLVTLINHASVNPYCIILVNPNRNKHVLENSGRKFINWITGFEGQKAINSYKINGNHPFKSAILVTDKNK